MTDKQFQLQQTVFKESYPSIPVLPLHENDLNEDILNAFLDTAEGTIGIAPAYCKCALVIIALSTPSQVLLVRLSKPKAKGRGKKLPKGRKLLRDVIFCHPQRFIAALRMDKLAAALYLDLALKLTGGIDLLSESCADRRSLNAIMNALGGESILHRGAVVALFKHREEAITPVRDIALQAWVACQAASSPCVASRLAEIYKIDTQVLTNTHIRFLAKTLRDADRLEAIKPTRVKNDIRPDFSYKDGNLNLMSDRFKTRLRTSSNQTIQIEAAKKGESVVVTGRAMAVRGRAATISLRSSFQAEKIKSVSTVGKDDLTSAESKREEVILQTLQHSTDFLVLPFVRRIWLPTERLNWPNPARPAVPLHFPSHSLNPTQLSAVEAILSDRDSDRLCLIHGPPGTGKTTVIAAGVTSNMARRDRSVWVVAHSNVAIKNVAEKLARVQFLDFKLIVSVDFHFDWHEHLYKDIVSNVIRSDAFNNHTVERLVLGSRVILCTLSMLSHPRLPEFVQLVPFETVIIDEASQIEIGDYIPMLSCFPYLQKLVFIGDDKQLGPYGHSDVPNLQSIFEMPHLRDRAIFLNIQYRMPRPIGNFISEHVYAGGLETVHKISTSSCCRFIDVEKGQEKSLNYSWVNLQELRSVISIARQYNKQQKSYRIITPYDAQRNAIEHELKSTKLPWKDKCFNVDSFQGNEDDHIIISLVRTDKIGFLNEPRRTNVMLTRCKKSMIMCTNKAFLEGVAAKSLVGILAATLGPSAWLSWRNVVYATF